MTALQFQLFDAVGHGQLQKARELGKQARAAADRLSLKEAVASEYAQEAFVEAVMGEKSRALDDLDRGLKLSNSSNMVLNAAGTLAIVGEDSRALENGGPNRQTASL